MSLRRVGALLVAALMPVALYLTLFFALPFQPYGDAAHTIAFVVFGASAWLGGSIMFDRLASIRSIWGCAITFASVVVMSGSMLASSGQCVVCVPANALPYVFTVVGLVGWSALSILAGRRWLGGSL